MKRFLLFLVIAIASISIGLTIYYFSTDNEVILIRNSYLVIEDGDTISTDSLVDFKHRDEHTQLSFKAQNTEEGISLLSYNANEGFFTAESGKGGETKIVVSTTNKNYPELEINVLVCDGSEEYPYIITSAEELSQIGKENSKYTTNKSYKLGADIAFKNDATWAPISSFSGIFDGNFYTISNVKITDESASTIDVGFIATLEQGGVVKNTIFKNLSIDVTSKNNVGAVVGVNKGTVMTTEVEGLIVSSKNGNCYVGGLVGQNLYNIVEENIIKAKVDRCGFEGNITLKGIDTTIDTTNNTQIAGGLVGYNYASVVSESYFRAIGDNKLSLGTGYFGGIVGLNSGYDTNTANIYDCYCYFANGIDETTSSYSNVGGIVYKNESATNSNIVLGNYYYCGAYNESGVSKLTNGNVCVASTNEKDKIEGNCNKSLTNSDFVTQNKFISYIKLNEGNRYWAFDSVWEMGTAYPTLNIHSATGSTYIIDFSEIKGENKIATAEELYTTLKKNNNGSFELVGDNKKIIDFSGLSWAWGDSAHELFDFNGTLTSDGYVIKNLKIVNTTSANDTTISNVGLFKTLGLNARVVGLKFENVTITYKQDDTSTRQATNVGVLAGVSDGATIVNVEIDRVNVDLNGACFGGIVGKTNERADKYFSNVTVKNLDARNGCFYYAGGFVGDNSTVITADRVGENFAYNKLIDIKLNANMVGGAVGKNRGTVSYVDASGVNFDLTDATSSIYTEDDASIGGIAGVNSGVISSVYVNFVAKTLSNDNFLVYIGGITGYNGRNASLSLGYVSDVTIDVSGNKVYAGGIAGANARGMISRSVVAKGTINCSVENKNNSISIVDNVPVVGGLVGLDGITENSYSIKECVSYMTSIKGAFAGGLVGSACGKVEKCHSGNQSKIVSITGFVAGGLSAIVSGEIKDCYTVCTLIGQYTDNRYEDFTSILNLKVSTVGGFTSILARSSAKIQGCYAVVTFKDGGVRLSTCADISSKYRQGEVVGCLYTTEGTVGANSFGKIISKDNLEGKGVAGYQSFFSNIGSESNSVWDTSLEGGYPQLKGVDSNLPSSIIE